MPASKKDPRWQSRCEPNTRPYLLSFNGSRAGMALRGAIRLDLLPRRLLANGEQESIGQVVERVNRMLDLLWTLCDEQGGDGTE